MTFSSTCRQAVSSFIPDKYVDLYLMQKDLKELLLQLGIRGLMTMLGMRKTVGSQDLPWPQSSVLLLNFNKLNTILSTPDST